MQLSTSAHVFQLVDDLVGMDVGNRGLRNLYASERLRVGKPLSLLFAETMQKLENDSVIILTTGSLSRSWLSNQIAENDGPSGLAILVSTILKYRKVLPILLIEESIREPVEAVFRAAGIYPCSVETVVRASENGRLKAVGVIGFEETNYEVFKPYAQKLLDEYNPQLLISVERSAANSKGIYHNMRGDDYSEGRAAIDALFDLAYSEGYTTLAIGDGGNEIGMGNVAPQVVKHVPFGAKCNCPCGEGIATNSKATYLLPAGCSNWGAYGVAAALCLIESKVDRFIAPREEEFIRRSGQLAGLINSVDGTLDINVDGISSRTHSALVAFLGELVAGERKN